MTPRAKKRGRMKARVKFPRRMWMFWRYDGTLSSYAYENPFENSDVDWFRVTVELPRRGRKGKP